MEFRILGPFEVIEDGQQLILGGARQRGLLAVLLLHRRNAVSTDRLVEQLWGDGPPPTAAKTVQVYVSRLRKQLGDGILETRGRGYALVVDPTDVDADRFEALAADGRSALDSGDARRALGLLGSALDLWRGAPLEEFTYEPFAQAEIRRLEEARLSVLEDRIDAGLRAGHGAELVGELEHLVAEHPLRERLVGGLMLALYRAGRQSEALAAYRSARGRLVEELGLEPAPELSELERRILCHDPTLTTGRPSAGREPRARASQPRPRSRSRSRRWPIAAAAALTAAIIAGAAFGPGAAHPSRLTLAGGNGLIAVDVHSGRLVTAAPFTDAVGAVGGGGGSVWVADTGAGGISRLDARSGATVDRIHTGAEPGTIVAGGGAIWAASTVGATIFRLDAATGDLTQTIAIPGSNLAAMAFGAGTLWIADSVARKLFEVDAATGSLKRTTSLRFQPSAIALADGEVWVAGYDQAVVAKIDPSSGRTTGTVRVGDGPAALAFAAGALWVANSLDATVSRIDPVTLKVVGTVPVGSGPSALEAGAGSVWVANQYSGDVARLDPRRNRIVASISVGGSPTSLTVASGRLWVGVNAHDGSHRGGTLVMVTDQRFPSVDPAFYNEALRPQFIGLAYDSLVTFQQSGTTDGLRLVPDLALAIPTPTDGGATYVFRVRRGIRYSNGTPVRAEDFRRAIERLFRVGSPGRSFFAGIVGASRCARRPPSCHLSRGIVTDDDAGSVTFHLTAPDPEFLFKLTEQGYSAPIARGTSDREQGSSPPPATGPYEISAAHPDSVRFTRNPFFREWSHAAQPEGNPDAIVWQHAATPALAVATVEHDRADWFFGLIPPSQHRALELRSPGQLHVSPQFGVDFAPLNTHRAPFNDVRVRRALNYAIDRSRIVQMYGGSRFATPACQPLAPGLPGYRRYCPYTLRSRSRGTGGAPDLDKAIRLVAESQTRGERVDVWGEPDTGYIPPQVPAYFARVLRSLGYRVRLHLVSYRSVTEAHREQFQLSVDGDWVAEYPDPSAYIPQFFSCGGGTSNGYYCNPRLDSEMQEASRLSIAHPLQAAALWASIDHRLADDAPWVPTVNQQEVDLVSSRLHNYEYNPVWGFLADQAWLG